MEYSVVIPVYNSQDSLEELYSRLKDTLLKITNEFEIIFVDDYSQDKSWEVLTKLKSNDKGIIKAIRLAKNYGQHNATFCGFKYVKGKYVITIDDDLQTQPEDIILLVEKINTTEVDLVYGIEEQANKKSIRNVGKQFFSATSQIVEGGLGKGSSFRIFKNTLLKNVMSHNQHFIFLDELLFWYTNFIDFVEVQKLERKHGNSGYSPFSMLKFISSITIFYGTWPLKLMTYGGAFFSLLSFVTGVYFIMKKVVLGINVAGFTATIVAISFSTSLILLCFGIIGKYLNNIYVVLNNKPVYSIKEIRL